MYWNRSLDVIVVLIREVAVKLWGENHSLVGWGVGGEDMHTANVHSPSRSLVLKGYREMGLLGEEKGCIFIYDGRV